MLRDGRRACGRTERGSLEELGEPTSSRPSAAKGPGGAITAEATGVDWRGNGEVDRLRRGPTWVQSRPFKEHYSTQVERTCHL